jgi:hypothetical protein
MSVDPAELWARSGCQALTSHGAGAPARLVEQLVGVITDLDAAGARLAHQFGAGGLGLLSERAATLMFPRSGRRSCGGATQLFDTADGTVAVTLARRADRELLPAWLGLDLSSSAVTSERNSWAEVARAVARRSSRELVELASLLGLACAAVGETPAGDALLVEQLGTASPRPVAGARIVNLASLWAGPLAGSVLVQLGADVVTVESTHRPDGARATPRWFDAMHAGQRSVAFDFRDLSEVDHLRRLLLAADVVIEGSRPRALAQLGIDAAEMAQSGPQIWVSITGHGRTGPAASRVGMGDDAAAAGGLLATVAGEHVFLADAIADPITGLHVARAIVERLSAGGRWLIDAALARTSAAAGGPLVPTDHAESPPRQRRADAPAFVLGMHTREVYSEWNC